MSNGDGIKYQWIRNITPILYRFRGQHHALINDLEKLSAEALEDLYRLLDGAQQEIHRLEHTFRPFPGGPQIRM